MAPKNTTQLVSDGKVIKQATPVLFGEVNLAMPDDPRIYENKSGLSTRLATMSVPINLVGGNTLTIASSVYAGLNKDGRLNIRVSLPLPIKVSKDLRDEYKTHVNRALLAWPFYVRAATQAGMLLKNPPKPKAKATTASDVSADDLTFELPEPPKVADTAA
jgi:hypothetical protein